MAWSACSPRTRDGDDIEIYTDESRRDVLMTFHNLRQQTEKPAGQFNHCLADFVAPKDSGVRDYLGGFAVTAGIGIDERVASTRRTTTTTTRSC